MAIRKLRMLGSLGGHRERPVKDYPPPPGAVIHEVKDDATGKVLRAYWVQPFATGDVLDFDTSHPDESDAVCDKLVRYGYAEDVAAPAPQPAPSPAPKPAPTI